MPVNAGIFYLIFANFGHSLNHKIMSYRIEKDTMGEVKVPAEKYWRQTERSRNNLKSPKPACQK